MVESHFEHLIVSIAGNIIDPASGVLLPGAQKSSIRSDNIFVREIHQGLINDRDGNCVYEYGEDYRLRKGPGGIFDFQSGEPDPSEFWVGSNGMMYFTSYDHDNEVPTIGQLNVNGNGEVSSTELWAAPGFNEGFGVQNTNHNYYYRIVRQNSIVFIAFENGSHWEFSEGDNQVINFELPDLSLSTKVAYSDDYYYLAEGTNLYKVSFADHNYSSILTPGEYEVYTMSVNNDEILQINALRFSDGRKIIAEINAQGEFNVIDEEQDKEALYLQARSSFHVHALYATRVDVGISKDHVLQIHNMHQMGAGADALKARLENNPVFAVVAKSGDVPPNIWTSDRYRAEGPDQPVVDLHYMRCDENYLPLLEAGFITGRNFDPSNAADKYHIIINEEAARVLGYGSAETWDNNSPLGKFVVQSFGSEEKFEIIGVVKDFNFNSVKQRIQPLLIMHNDNDKHWSYTAGFPAYLSMRLKPASVTNGDELHDIIDNIKAEARRIDPSVTFEYSFMDDEFDNTFREERKMSVVLNLFTILAIVVACLGLFGLAAFSADQRRKELGIRKLHGASVRQLMLLFSSEFTKLVALSIVIAAPVAYLMTDYWLSNFAYRTPMDLWVFVAAGATALSIAAITVGLQSFSAANANPVEVLKSE